MSYGLGCGSEFRGKKGKWEKENNDKDCYWKENLCQGYQGECLVLLTGFMPALRMELFVILSSLSAFSSVITTIKNSGTKYIINVREVSDKKFWPKVKCYIFGGGRIERTTKPDHYIVMWQLPHNQWITAHRRLFPWDLVFAFREGLEKCWSLPPLPSS